MDTSSENQLNGILAIEEAHKNDLEVLIPFWETLWDNGGLKFNGIKWTFRLVELYYKAGRYDDAWRMLDRFILTKPAYRWNIRKWQIRILKKEKKDYSHIQGLLDKGM